MKPPFSNHPMIRRFNELKKYFRKYETGETRSRVKEFRHYSRTISQTGFSVAFDFLGSVNFGQATHHSDVDLVVYLRCRKDAPHCDMQQCRQIGDLKREIMETLTGQFLREQPYDIEIVDCIDLDELEQELARPDPESDLLLRFAFYRSVCRIVNARLIRPYHLALTGNPELMRKLEPHLFPVFDILGRNSRHSMSMKKYQERIRDLGVSIPSPILERIQEHLYEGEAAIAEEWSEDREGSPGEVVRKQAEG